MQEDLSSKQINDILIDYYSKKVSFYKTNVNLPSKYIPENWIHDEDTIINDFADTILKALNDVDSGFLTYTDIKLMTINFYYTSVVKKGILIDEIRKTNKLFDTLFIDCKYEIIDIGKEYCNTWRELLELICRLILEPEIYLDKYEENPISWTGIVAAGLVTHNSVNKYLLKCLENETGLDVISSVTVLENLCFQKDKSAIKIIDKYLYHDKERESDVQQTSIEYLGGTESKIAIEKLEELMDSGKLQDENKASLLVALIRLRQGEKGLIKLYQESFDWKIHWEIINYYKFYRSQKYAQIVLSALNDSTKFDNGHYPIRANAVHVLKEELLSNLIRWFGVEIINILDNVETDEDNK